MSIQLKFISVLIVLSVCCSVFNVVYGKPSTDSEQNPELVESALHRMIRGTGTRRDGICSPEAGCHKGRCWAYCGLLFRGGEWCYTTRGNTFSGNYVSCTNDSECDRCWKCGGACTV